jgi:hypothetical protein
MVSVVGMDPKGPCQPPRDLFPPLPSETVWAEGSGTEGEKAATVEEVLL